MDKKIFFEKMQENSKVLGFNFSVEQLEKFYKYMNLLIEWNEKMNLTAIVDEHEIIVKHFVDCLMCTKVIKDEKNIIDIGTGAGFPGMVLAIYYEDKEFTLLDALNKRLIFLQEVANKLDLKNVHIVHGRAEEEARKEEFREKFDATVSRAVAQLPILLEYISPFVKVGGKSIIMKGDSVQEEIKLSTNALNVLKLKINRCFEYVYTINNEDYHRNILIIQKNMCTPPKYPRNYGQIKKKTL